MDIPWIAESVAVAGAISAVGGALYTLWRLGTILWKIHDKLSEFLAQHAVLVRHDVEHGDKLAEQGRKLENHEARIGHVEGEIQELKPRVDELERVPISDD